MDNDLSQALFERLVDKAFEGMSREEKLAFIEKLFAELPPATQQEFLLNLTRRMMGVEKRTGRRKGPRRGWMSGSPLMRRMLERGPREFGPWQMCCRAMDEFVQAPRPEPTSTATAVRLFNALADETRLKIIKLLSEGEKNVDELVQALGIAQSTTSHHLRVLREAGLIRGKKRGRSVYYTLTQPLYNTQDSSEESQ